jgi:hypothetical protein
VAAYDSADASTAEGHDAFLSSLVAGIDGDSEVTHRR